MSSVLSSSGMSLESIGLTLGLGLGVSFITIIAFGIAVMKRNTNIAPRCTARHPNTIWRRRKDMYGKPKKKRKKKKKNMKKQGGQNQRGQTTSQTAAVNNDAAADVSPPSNQQTQQQQQQNNNGNQDTKKVLKRPSITKRSNSIQEFTLNAPRIATKLVTGVDMNGMARSQQSIRELEEQEQQLDFVQNSLGQPVYVGGSTAARNRNQPQSSLSSSLPPIINNNAVSSVGGNSNNETSAETLDDDMNMLANVFTAPHLAAAAAAVDVGEPVLGVGGDNKDDDDDSDDEYECDTEVNDELYSHPQDRGNPFLGWIPWTLHLSYDRMLRGIPGTGTRNGGMSGQLLAVNLDAIILFKFHALCLRVTVFACIICIGIILPLNLSGCDSNDTICRFATSYSGENTTTVLTNYGRTTIANIPYNAQSKSILASFSKHFFDRDFWTNSTFQHLIRLYTIGVCTWFIYYFALKNIKREWTENLVLRRVYYLESDHYGQRQSELGKTVNLPREKNSDEDSDDEMDLKKRRAINKSGRNVRNYKQRQPWIPDPEHRDTVPNIELYSVLVGGLPSLPNEVVNKTDMDTAVQASARSNIDWQLAVATTFFDHCVPNQPGFSSSVVAVTILPGAKELAKSWRKWYAAAAALRRLRFIRNVINEKRHYSIDDVQIEDEEDDDDEAIPDSDVDSGTTNSKPRVTFLDEETAAHRFQDLEANRQAAQYRQTYGEQQNPSEIDTRIFRSLNYGPEQQAVYSREMAQGAAACCPNGCCEGRVRRQAIDRLLEMEEATIERLENAQRELQEAQKEAAVIEGDKMRSNDAVAESENETEIMLMPTSNEVEQRLNGPPTIDVQPKNVGFSIDSDDINHQRDARATSESSNGGATSPRSSPIKNSLNTSSIMRMNSEGKFLFQTFDEMDNQSFAGESYMESSLSLRRRANTGQSETSLRRRANTGLSSNAGGAAPSLLSQENTSSTGNQWDRVNSIMRGENAPNQSTSDRTTEIETGVWEKPTIRSCLSGVRSEVISCFRAIGKWTKAKSDPIASSLAKHSTYAVVTFSSRQAAVAARHCLADGRGQHRWLSLETVPVPPLADAAPCDIITCRGCCRPVTLNINQNEQLVRKYCANASLLCIYIFYTVPIATAQSLVEPSSLQKTFPRLYDLLENGNGFISANILSGLVGALLYTTFFALCPVMFKAIANSGSKATSVQEAEKYALKYYWFFMLVTAFVGQIIANAAIQIWNSSELEDTVQTMLKNIAANIPLGASGIWLQWIIVRTTMTLPLQYLIQVNSFVFEFFGLKCCARCVMGGGPGGPIPYRIYIDGGVVFLCVVALAPQSPLVCVAALLYYFFCIPLWRRNCIFMYRPKFDSGGERWPFLSDVLISSLFMGQLLLTLQMILRDAFGPAIVAAAPAIPTYLFRKNLKKRFERAYKDAGLLQMSLLDGWDNSMATTVEKREEFRQFLVDAHKAAYIPVCIAGGATNVLTAEPAVVVASDNDDMLGYSDVINEGGQAQIPPQDHLSPYFGDQAPVFFSSGGTNNSIPSPSSLATPNRTIMTRRTNGCGVSPSPTNSSSRLPYTQAPSTPWQGGDKFDSVPQNLEEQGCTQS